ncbi:MAG: hypothetical protein, partial [Olavius algarvensis spirochete endosymbiont]
QHGTESPYRQDRSREGSAPSQGSDSWASRWHGDCPSGKEAEV